jgi:signal transduction histidine kinase
MKKIAILAAVFTFGLCLAVNALAADKGAIQKNVDGIVGEIDGGKAAADFNANDYDPYAFIMEESGNLIVHPSLAGQSLKEKAAPVYDAIIQATPEGTWVDYEWKGAMKHSYVKKTGDGLIVGSGYSD